MPKTTIAPSPIPAGTPSGFHWEPQPEAQGLLNELVARFLSLCPPAARLKEQMTDVTGTRFFDWIDHLGVPNTGDIRQRLEAAGFRPAERDGTGAEHANSVAMVHPGALFPTIVLNDASVLAVGVKVDSVIDFAVAHDIPDTNEVMGDPYSQLRVLVAHSVKPSSGDVSLENPRAELWAVERRGYDGFEPGEATPKHVAKLIAHREAIIRRDRCFMDDHGDYTVGGKADLDAFHHLWRILDAAIADLGVDTTCELFFEGERIYWENTNRAGQVQHLRQNRLGLGWANHDHHTYRCARANYPHTIATFEKLGFFCRERFYAGEEAGWGAQVLEQPRTGIVIFADVDMSAEELKGDFAHDGFAQRDGFGTVGMWVALHGEAILQAGMHHLECQFDHHALVSQLKDEAGIDTMDPFTTFPYLRQAFTEGERKLVHPKRLEHLQSTGQITAEQAEAFRTSGALHSHLENLERNDGFKGFNQQGVSDIISRTDPRKQQAVATD
jgi:hypothetical protein